MKLVISDINQLALNDIIHLCKQYPFLIYEISTKTIQDDSKYYKNLLKSHVKKTKVILNITEDHLNLYKTKGLVKDYILDELLSFTDYFRI